MAKGDPTPNVSDVSVLSGRALRNGASSGSARSLLLTVLGELVYPNGQPVWTASLLHVMTGIGIEEQTARQTIARCAAAGWLIGEKHGREVCWELTASVKRLIENGMGRVYSLHAADQQWSGTWLILLVTVPQSHRAVRRQLYQALSWVGFGNPVPGVWLSPHSERVAEAERVINDLDLTESTLSFVGGTLPVGLTADEIVQRGWVLGDVADTYQGLLDEYRDLRPGPGDPTLLTHVELASQLQRLPFLDPQLPEELLPDWIGRHTISVIQERRSEWYEAAQERWLEVVAATSPS